MLEVSEEMAGLDSTCSQETELSKRVLLCCSYPTYDFPILLSTSETPSL